MDNTLFTSLQKRQSIKSFTLLLDFSVGNIFWDAYQRNVSNFTFSSKKGTWFIFVEDSEETKVKTEKAIRKVPVHPQLIDLGFVDYVTAQKKSKRDRLFWELSEDRDGFASHVSRHYNERFLPAVGVWKKYTKVLYCTRHTFINKLYSEMVDENVIKTLVGHEKEFTKTLRR